MNDEQDELQPLEFKKRFYIRVSFWAAATLVSLVLVGASSFLPKGFWGNAAAITSSAICAIAIMGLLACVAVIWPAQRRLHKLDEEAGIKDYDDPHN